MDFSPSHFDLDRTRVFVCSVCIQHVLLPCVCERTAKSHLVCVVYSECRVTGINISQNNTLPCMGLIANNGL